MKTKPECDFYTIPKMELIDNIEFKPWTLIIYLSFFIYMPTLFYFFQQKDQTLVLLSIILTSILSNILFTIAFPHTIPIKVIIRQMQAVPSINFIRFS